MFGSQLWEMNNSFIFENTNDTSLWVINSIDDMNQLENNKHFFFFFQLEFGNREETAEP